MRKRGAGSGSSFFVIRQSQDHPFHARCPFLNKFFREFPFNPYYNVVLTMTLEYPFIRRGTRRYHL
ncbi:MAG TPA: hypothetical protein DDX59_03300 [Lachnospiraceae bacterium]|nr:hypothetical protein [Lachnospiraceae bacterium]